MPYLDASVATTTATSYVTRADANAFLARRLFADAWDAASNTDDGERDRALMMATELIDAEFLRLGVVGAPVSLAQRLQWPRALVALPYDPDTVPVIIGGDDTAMLADPFTGYYRTDIIIPPIVEATCLLALELIRALAAGKGDPTSLDDSLLVKREKVGPLETEYVEARDRRKGLARYPEVRKRLAPFFLASRGPKAVRA
jgi:hypothetical protein